MKKSTGRNRQRLCVQEGDVQIERELRDRSPNSNFIRVLLLLLLLDVPRI